MNKVHNGNDALEVIMTCFKRKGWTNAHSSRIYYIKFITFDSLLYILYRVFLKESAKTPNTLSTFTIFNEFHKKISSLSSDDATIQLIWLWEFCWKTFFDGRLRLYLVNSLPFEKTNETAVCLWNLWISINYHHHECIFYQFKWH